MGSKVEIAEELAKAATESKAGLSLLDIAGSKLARAEPELSGLTAQPPLQNTWESFAGGVHPETSIGSPYIQTRSQPDESEYIYGHWGRIRKPLSDADRASRQTKSLEKDRPNELVVSNEKTIGSRLVTTNEGTRQLDLSAISDSPNKFDFAQVRDLVHRVNSRLGADLTYSDASGAIKTLSVSGSNIYRSLAELKTFSDAVEKIAKDGRYSTIVADDLSGRLPALFVHDQLQRLAEIRGTTAPRLLFMAGGFKGLGGSDAADRPLNMLTRIASEDDEFKRGRALLLTEIIHTGSGIKQFNEAFNRAHIKFDVAAMETKTDLNINTLLSNDDVQLMHGSLAGNMYLLGAGSGTRTRIALGVEKYGSEATVRRVETAPLEEVGGLRDELYQLARYNFESGH